MDFSVTSRIVWQANVCETFQLSPATPTMLSLKSVKVMDGVADGNNFNLRDFADYFDLFRLHGTVIIHSSWIDVLRNLLLIFPIEAEPTSMP